MIFNLNLNQIGLKMGSTTIDQVKQDFDIQGELEDDWADFDPNTEYDGFLVRRKK